MATAAALKLFSGLLLSIFLVQAMALCTLSDLTVMQIKTGSMVGGAPEYEVTVSNNCICSQTDVTLRCVGFQTTENVDQSIFKQVSGEECLVNDGMPIFMDSPIKFKYAWETPTDLSPLKSQVNCS